MGEVHMGRTVVLYKSSTGFTKHYAEWIGERLQCEVKENRGVSVDMLKGYDTIILGGYLATGMESGVRMIKKNFALLKDKKIAVFGCGMAIPSNEFLEKMAETNFTEEQRNHIRCFYCRGGLNLSKLRGLSRFMLTIMCKQMEKKEEKTQYDKDMAEALSHPVDFTDVEYIEPILNYITQ